MVPTPGFVWVAQNAEIAAFLVGLCVVLYTGLRGRGEPGAIRVAVGAGALLLGWLLVATVLAENGAFQQDPRDLAVPWIGLAIGGSLVVWLLATRLPAVSTALADQLAPARLAALQSFRVVGVVLIVLMVLGDLPAAFALPAGLGDLATGLAAPFVAARLYRHPHDRRGAIWFNALGLVDLIVAVSIGFAAAPGPLQLLFLTPSTEAVTVLPGALIPVVAVPLAAALHIWSLRRLTTAPIPATVARPQPVAG
jgi:hypothetical protein